MARRSVLSIDLMHEYVHQVTMINIEQKQIHLTKNKIFDFDFETNEFPTNQCHGYTVLECSNTCPFTGTFLREDLEFFFSRRKEEHSLDQLHLELYPKHVFHFLENVKYPQLFGLKTNLTFLYSIHRMSTNHFEIDFNFRFSLLQQRFHRCSSSKYLSSIDKLHR